MFTSKCVKLKNCLKFRQFKHKYPYDVWKILWKTASLLAYLCFLGNGAYSYGWRLYSSYKFSSEETFWRTQAVRNEEALRDEHDELWCEERHLKYIPKNDKDFQSVKELSNLPK